MYNTDFWQKIISNLYVKFKLNSVKGSDGKRYFRFVLNGIRYAIPAYSLRTPSLLSRMVEVSSEIHINNMQIKELKNILIGSSQLLHGKNLNIYRRFGVAKNGFETLLDGKEGIVARTSKNGVRVLCGSRYTYHHSEYAAPLPEPDTTADGKQVLNEFQRLAGLSKPHLKVAVCLLLQAISSRGPFLVGGIVGESGPASTLGYMLKSVVDPETGHTRNIPANENDLYASMGNAQVIVYNNVSSISHKIADAICRHSSGCAAAKSLGRSDDDEMVFWASRFFIIVGCEVLPTNNNLSEQLVLLEARRNDEMFSMTEGDIRSRFLALRPKLLGVLLNALSFGLNHVKDMQFDTSTPATTNMKLSVASARYFGWSERMIVKSFEINRTEVSFRQADSDVLVHAILSFLRKFRKAEGSPSEVFEKIQQHLKDTDNIIALQHFPKDVATFGKRLKQSINGLEVCGVECVITKPHEGRKLFLYMAARSNSR